MYTEDDFILISALQHFVYCPWQCALIHVEGAWNENLFTVYQLVKTRKYDKEQFSPVRDYIFIKRIFPNINQSPLGTK